MDIRELNLNMLMEECSEVIKCASKQKRFGPHYRNPGKPYTNSEAMRMECMDVALCIRYLVRTGQMQAINEADIDAHERTITPKIEHMRAVSRALGLLVDTPCYATTNAVAPAED